MIAVVRFRNPFPPHEELAHIRASDVTYGLQLMRPNTASFSVPRSDANLTDFGHELGVGAMVSIERDDGRFPWVGFVNRKRTNDRNPDALFDARDHAGALFVRARTPKDWVELQRGSGEIIKEIFDQAEGRAEPPLLVRMDVEAGPPLAYTPKAESLLRFLDRMAEFTGWEWYLRHELSGGEVVSYLVWRGEVGVDVRNEATWEQNIHFARVSYWQDADGYIGTGLAVGGSGTFRTRLAAAVSVSGQASEGIETVRLGDFEESAASPALMGTAVVIDQQIRNKEALLAAARRLHRPTDRVRERLSLTLVESTVNLDYVAVGNIVTVRLADINLGAGLTRPVRIQALEFNPERGTIDAELEIVRELV